MKKTAHIQIGNSTLCRFPLAKHHGCNCEYQSVAEARQAAKTLRAHFGRGRVKVVAGGCPSYQNAPS